MQQQWSNIVLDAMREVGQRLLVATPRVLAALTLLLLAWVVASLARRVTTRILRAADMESGNFYQLLRERYGIAVAEAVQTIEPAVANPEQAELLDIDVYAPLLQIERTTKDTTGRTVEFTHSVYRGDRYRITTRLHLDATSG